MKRVFLFITLAVLLVGCSDDDNVSWADPTIPVSLVGIETINVDNSGEFPVVANSSVKKDAYMVGVKWLTDNTPTDDDKFITGSIQKGDQTFSRTSEFYSKAIKCNTPFNEKIPAGKYVSKFFKEIDRDYLPKDVHEGFVLLVAPDPGEHSFRVEYYDGDKLMFFHDTPLIKFD